jgi:formate dehydrogenase subunit gamma
MLKPFAKGLAAAAFAAAAWLPAAQAQQAARPDAAPAAPAAAAAAAAAPAAAAAAPAAAAPAVAEKPAGAPSLTAVPGWNNPPAWSKVDTLPQYASVRGNGTDVLVQTAGQEWRKIRNGPVTVYGGWFMVAVLAILVLVYLVKGTVKVHGQPAGRMIERFNEVERVAHWTMAISFVLLGLTGVLILFGKHIIMPWLGQGAFAAITEFSKTAHNFIGPLFVFSIVVFALLFLKDNLPAAHDVKWVAGLGGLFAEKEIPSGKFNAGEKAVFWGGVVGLGLIVSATGLIMDFPNWNTARDTMQLMNLVHGIAAILFIGLILGHAYMGTIGTAGAFQAMKTGQVDETWAKEHHELWYNEVKSGKRSGGAPAMAQPAQGDD